MVSDFDTRLRMARDAGNTDAVRRLNDETRATDVVSYSPDHRPGMRVPKGGSMCANCEYLRDAESRVCGNPDFIRWNGSETIPAPVDEYCSDWYEPEEGG